MIFRPIGLISKLFVLNFLCYLRFCKLSGIDSFAVLNRSFLELMARPLILSVNASNYVDLQLFFDHLFFTICNCWKSFSPSICLHISKRLLRLFLLRQSDLVWIFLPFDFLIHQKSKPGTDFFLHIHLLMGV
jgi:hypothetical protein